MNRILFLGDIIGRTGREGVKKALPQLIGEYAPDWVIANCENTGDEGIGLSHEALSELTALGVDAFSAGNHTFDLPDHVDVFRDSQIRICRPVNWRGNMPGNGYCMIEKNGKRLLLMNALGRTFMSPPPDDPFTAVERMLNEHSGRFDASLLDMHAEATSEKRVIAEYFDGRLNAVVGTHTHVQTNDARTLRKGTAFLTDAGMCGPAQSIIGFDTETYTRRTLTGIPELTAVPNGDCEIAGCIIDCDSSRTTITPIRFIISLS
jgi:metallophosphoesterase (TIGR00282 family)